MANVKITDLTELAAADLATNDVLPIVDINNDSTKKVTIASLDTRFASNDFITFTQLNANLNVLDANADAIEARRVANVTVHNNEDTALQARIAANTLVAASNDFITFTRLNANLDIVQDNVAAISVTLGIRGDGGTNDDVTVGTEELVFTGDTGITTAVSSNVVTIDLDDTAVTAGLYGGVSGGVTNVAAVTIDATGRITNAANVSVVTDLDTIQDNVVRVQQNAAANTDAVEARRVANIAGAVSTITTGDLTASRALASDSSGKVAVSAVTATELGYLDGVTSAIQTQFAGAETRRTNNIAGAISTVLTADLTASRALISGSGGKIEVSAVTATELGYVDGVSGAIQTQIDALEARRAANNITTTFTDDVVITGNLTINGDTTTVSTTNLDVEDRIIMLADGVSGSPSADVGLLFNRGNQGNAAFFYDESGKTFKLSDTKDPKSNTSLSPVTSSNLSVGIVDAATLKYNGTSVQDAISANVTTLTNEDTALQARITANATITTAVEARRVANIAGAISTVTTSDLTADRVMITNGSGKIAASSGVTPTELGYLDGLTLGTVAASKAVTADSNGDVNFIREVDIDGNVVIGTNDSNTVTIVGKLDLGAFS